MRALVTIFVSLLCACAGTTEVPVLPVSSVIRASVDHPDRPDRDRARDPDRKPDQVLEFFGIEEGMSVADVMAGDGYYTELLSRVVGTAGTVYCQNSASPLSNFAERPLTERLARPGLENVVRLDRELTHPGFPDGLDAALLIRFYHDFSWQKVDRAQFNRTMFSVLKSGAVFGVVDHHALAGAGDTVGQRLHRVEADMVQREIEAAGFVLEAKSAMLSNPDDTRDWNIFSGGGVRRDKTDRFVYRFRKP